DSEMPDAPLKSPSPPAQDESTDKPSAPEQSAASTQPQSSELNIPPSPASTAISPGTKEDVVMDDAHAQPEQSSAADRAESTQDTAISDVPAATPADEANDAAASPTNAGGVEVLVASPSAPITADTSLSEPSQTATKVSRERDIDSEDEPVAKRARVDKSATAEAVEVKPEAEPDRMEVDQPQAADDVALYKGDGKPKNLADSSLNGSPITNYMARQLRQVLAGVKKTKAGASFKASVQELWPALWSDYSAKITNPIDIGTMEKKLRGDLPKYATMGDFKSDVALIVQNSITFNGAEHEVTVLAKQLQETIYQRMAGSNAAEPPKSEKKEPAKQHPTRHAEPRSSATAQPAPTASPQRPPKNADAPPKPPVESAAYAIPANNNGVPLIRRDSTKGKRTVKPTHPKDLPYDGKRKKKLSPELRFCGEVLDEIRKGKYYEWNNAFLQPVDPVALQIPTYHKIVRKPMDLQTMKEKLDGGDYTSFKEFERDFELIVKNCKLFNGEQHLVYKQALDLQQLFKKEFSKKDEWLAKHAPATPAPQFHAASPAPKAESEDEDHESEAEAEDPEIKAGDARLATIQRRLAAEQQKLNDMIDSGADIDDVEVTQSVIALLQKNYMTERQKVAQLKQKPSSKPKPAKPKKAAAGGGGSKKATGGGNVNERPSKKAGGAKKVAKRKMGVVEKEIIAAGIAELEGSELEKAIDIIKKDTGQGENDSGELELDIEQLSDVALAKLYDIATTAFPDLRAKYEQPAAAPPPVQAAAPRNKAAAKNKKNKPMSKLEQERRIAQLNNLRAQAAVRQSSGSQEPMESIEGNGNGRASVDPVPNRDLDSEDE
ncbi:hypothetical protein B0T16DRAFT_294739, partial [Cercophora newfieldiana]